MVSHETPGSLVMFHLLPCGLPDRNIPHVPVASGFLFGKVTGGGLQDRNLLINLNEIMECHGNHGNIMEISRKYHGNIMKTSWTNHEIRDQRLRQSFLETWSSLVIIAKCFTRMSFWMDKNLLSQTVAPHKVSLNKALP